jgi:hypothetical protein
MVSVGASRKVVPAKAVGTLNEACTPTHDNDPRVVGTHHGDPRDSAIWAVVNVHSAPCVMHIGDPAIGATHNCTAASQYRFVIADGYRSAGDASG